MAAAITATLRAGLPDRYLTPEDIAALLTVPLETVYAWRKKRTGPPGFRIGKHLRYDPTAVHAWINALTEAERDAA
ncbi:helix-turn-helix domain-containing protein [Streptomyces anulatus]|uniref:helix-turn-helix transcriptional regulator n=1 Tax=Streptomyces anulatus TaxID=1892 RepID=UPI002DDC275C|nr:helix-turn-helix domain-containing protein [Streptomyces anulatus]MDF9807000.1 excisionase family DNA binding protein [Streptomyces sp. HB372]WSC64442.1 helix-turn-helix domain-containing protein [Streptomyces anulatus]WUD88485.1 helix-turn-helix domain-containing protein [Streptomyces anulatus]